MRLIDAYALTDELAVVAYTHDCLGILEAINNAPTIDAEPVKHGEWIMHIDDLFPEESTMECNQCHEHQPLTIDDNYCPNCGAKMNKGGDTE